MKKQDKKLLKDFTKPELLKIIKNQDFQLERLEKEYHRALRTIASYRNIIQTEMRSTPEYWNNILDDMIEEDEQTPPGFKEPSKKSKHLEGYS